MGDGGWGRGALVSDALIINLPVGSVCPCSRGTRFFVGIAVGARVSHVLGWVAGAVGSEVGEVLMFVVDCTVGSFRGPSRSVFFESLDA